MIYICGPMRGLTNDNVSAFRAAAELLRGKGLGVISPHEINLDLDPATAEPEEYIRRDVVVIARHCYGIALLPGWERSVGARCEVALGLTLHLKFFDATTGERRDEPELAVCYAGGYHARPARCRRVCACRNVDHPCQLEDGHAGRCDFDGMVQHASDGTFALTRPEKAAR